jgi:hypothetical protein
MIVLRVRVIPPTVRVIPLRVRIIERPQERVVQPRSVDFEPANNDIPSDDCNGYSRGTLAVLMGCTLAVLSRPHRVLLRYTLAVLSRLQRVLVASIHRRWIRD